jgi:hypothetical protein
VRFFKQKCGEEKLLRHVLKWVDIMTMGVKETHWEGVDWSNFAQDRGQWQAVANTVINLKVTQKAGNFLLADQLLASR